MPDAHTAPVAIPATIPEEKRPMVARIVAQLRETPGVAAVVLGGSYAAGTQRPDSDVDLGIYYAEARPFAIADIRRIAEGASDGAPPTVTGFYAWGAWVNGGAWLRTAHGKVDFLYRSLEHVRRTVDEAQRGVARHDYDQQPTHGFYSVTYLAETQVCVPLYDPDGLLAELKRLVAAYPPALRERVVRDSLWSAEFTLLHARGHAGRGDVYNTAGCLARAAANLTQALFALNERYYMRDKQVMETISGFAAVPAGYAARLQRTLAAPGSAPPELTASVAAVEALWREVAALPGVSYSPQFNL